MNIVLPNSDTASPAGEASSPRITWIHEFVRQLREKQDFDTALIHVDRLLLRKYPYVGAKRRLKKLMNTLIEHPSWQTLELFTTLQQRYGGHVNAYEFLENNWRPWVTSEMRLELIRHKSHDDQPVLRLIDLIEAEFNRVVALPRLGIFRTPLRMLLRMVVELTERGTLRNELISIIVIRLKDDMRITDYEYLEDLINQPHWKERHGARAAMMRRRSAIYRKAYWLKER